MSYSLNFYIKERGLDKPKLLYHTGTNSEFARAFTEVLEEDIPFLIDNSEQYYTLTNDDFNQVIKELEESIKSSNELVKKWRKDVEDKKEMTTSLIAKLVASKVDQDMVFRTVENFREEHNYESSIQGQIELVKENEELKYNIEMLQVLNMFMTSRFAIGDFEALLVNIT